MSASPIYPPCPIRPCATLAEVLLLAALLLASDKVPLNVSASYTEKSIAIIWDSVPGAVGYHMYTSAEPGATPEDRLRVNRALITSGTRYTYIWNVDKGELVRAIKGNRHYLAVCAVFDRAGEHVEGPYSKEIDNCYFENFERTASRSSILRVLRSEQHMPYLPVPFRDNSPERFARFMAGPGRLLQRMVRDSIDPTVVGGCVPLSTIAVQLLDEWGLKAYRVEGVFIREFHSFVVIGLDDVEYVLDISADQFVPNAAPVLVPRDLCFLSDQGRFAAEGQSVYVPAKVYAPRQSRLNQSKTSRVYRTILNSVLASRKRRRREPRGDE